MASNVSSATSIHSLPLSCWRSDKARKVCDAVLPRGSMCRFAVIKGSQAATVLVATALVIAYIARPLGHLPVSHAPLLHHDHESLIGRVADITVGTVMIWIASGPLLSSYVSEESPFRDFLVDTPVLAWHVIGLAALVYGFARYIFVPIGHAGYLYFDPSHDCARIDVHARLIPEGVMGFFVLCNVACIAMAVACCGVDLYRIAANLVMPAAKMYRDNLRDDWQAYQRDEAHSIDVEAALTARVADKAV